METANVFIETSETVVGLNHVPGNWTYVHLRSLVYSYFKIDVFSVLSPR